MGISKWIVGAVGALLVAGCSGSWEVNYDQGIDPEVSRGWRVVDVVAVVPEQLRVSNANTFAPSADIVWHGEPFGDRKAQVAAVIDEGITAGTAGMEGLRPVTITAVVKRFHAVTPAAVARAPAAVHNIQYVVRAFDASSGAPLTEEQVINADLEAYVGSAAIAAAINGETQRNRIVAHLAAVTRGWLGFGPDQRRTFSGLGR